MFEEMGVPMLDQQPNPSGLHRAHVLNFGSLNIDRVFRVPRITGQRQTNWTSLTKRSPIIFELA